MKILIVGYGKAGQRHHNLINKLIDNCSVYAVDPVVPVHYKTIEEALSDLKNIDIAVIASPPDSHLQDIEMCVNAKVKSILCEKPLCGFDQLKKARTMTELKNVMIAYNYRWHPNILSTLTSEVKSEHGKWEFFSDGWRPPLPKWGLLLDHFGHTADLLGILAPKTMIQSCTHIESILNDGYKSGEILIIYGKTIYNRDVSIIDCVRSETKSKRVAYINGPMGRIDLSDPKDMFERMWKSFLLTHRENVPFIVDIKSSLYAQELLEEAKSKLIKREIAKSISEMLL